MADLVDHSLATLELGSKAQPEIFELTIFAASGFQPRNDAEQLGGMFRDPKFFVRVRAGTDILVQTEPSKRTLTPEWNFIRVVPVNPSQQLTFEIFRHSSVRRVRSLGFFEATTGDLYSAGASPQAQPAPQAPPALALSTEIEPNPERNLVPHRPEAGGLQPSEGSQVTISRIFALIIGIDEYESPNKARLGGAARDARNMQQLLQTFFGVPEPHIRLLCNQDATRSRIIGEFKSLANDRDLQPGDAVIIYFAGHGSRAPAPESSKWRAEDGMVETICPVDEESKDEDLEVYGIPDQTIGALVYKISQLNGENIALVFDCCHSGGLARGDAPRNEVWRSAITTSRLPEDLDEDIWTGIPQSRSGDRRAGLSASLSNYVLLAACRPNEKAMETVSAGQSCGAFSDVLFRHIRLANPTTTYSELLTQVARELATRNSDQNPVCEGQKKDRPIFDGIAVRRDLKLFTLTAAMEEPATYHVNAGAVYGIVPGCRLTIFRFNSDSGTFIEVGALEVMTVSVGSSTLRAIADAISFIIQPDYMAAVESWGQSEHLLDVFLEDLDRRWLEQPFAQPRYHTVSERSQRSLVLRKAGGNRISFERGSPIAEYTNVPLHPPIDFTAHVLQRALNSINDFHFHLCRANPSPSPALQGKVSLRIHKLDEEGNGGEDLFVNGRAVVTPEADYGFTIVNESSLDLFPYFYFFDPTKYSIQSWYYPTLNMPAPLSGNKGTTPRLKVGCDNDDPFFFGIPQGATSDLGFLKLFVSTCEVEMHNLAQDSPFLTQNIQEPPAHGSGISRTGGTRTRKRNEAWDECCYTVIICKDENDAGRLLHGTT